MPDTSSASDAGVGAEALLGLASGQRVRLPSVCSLPDATKPANPTHTFHPPPQRTYLPSPPLHLPDQSPPPIRSFPPPSTTLLPPATERLPTLAEWAPIPLQPLHLPHPPHPSPERPWSSSSNLPAPYAYTHSQLPWTPHPRTHQFQPPQQSYYSYHNPQPIPSQRNPNTSSLHTSVSSLRPPFALPVPRADVSSLRPRVPHIPALDQLCEAAAANASTSSLRSIAAAHPTSQPSPVIRPPLHPTSLTTPLNSCVDTVEQPITPPVRARGLADLINPTDSSPATTDNASNHIHTPIISRSSYELSEERTIPPLPFPLLSIPPICTNIQPLQPESAQEFDKTPTTMGRKSTKKKRSSADAASSSPVMTPHSSNTPKSPAKPDRKSVDSTPESTSSKRDQCNGTEGTPNDNDLVENSESEITRCPCGSSESSGFMIACDDCNTWQHSRCMGYRRRSDLPEKYYCNICRPEKMRIGCIAHPRYKEKNGKDREGREFRRDQEAFLSSVKPSDLRKIFLADLKHKKSLLNAGKDHMVMKYASLMKIQFPKHRQSILDGLVVLLDMSPSDVSEKLDTALCKLRQPSEKQDSIERKQNECFSISDSTQKESALSSLTNGKLGLKRHRPQAAPTDTPEEMSLAGLESFQSADPSGEMDMNDLAGLRGMSREERKLRETMKLFARMEEREKKRPRLSDNTNSPKSGLQSRPKTPRGGSRTTSKPGTPNTPTDWDYRRHRSSTDRDENNADCVETSRDQDADDDDASSPVKDVSPSVFEKREKTSKPDGSRHSHRSISSFRSEVEMPQATPKRDRSKSERNTTRRKDSSDVNALTATKRLMMSERLRSHDIKRRRIGGRDSCSRNAKDAGKREPGLNFAVHVPGPSVLGSKLIPNWRLSQLELERKKAEEEEMSATAMKQHPLIKKNNAIRREHLRWEVKLIEATPVKKRLRTPLFEKKLDFINVRKELDGNSKLTNDQGAKLNGNEAGTAAVSPQQTSPSDEVVGQWKKFCLKKRRAMLEIMVNENDDLDLHNKKETIPDDAAVISPVSPGGTGTPVTLKSCTVKNELTANAHSTRVGAIKSTCSPRLRSSPVSAMRTPKLRSVPHPTAKRAKPLDFDERSDRGGGLIDSSKETSILETPIPLGDLSKKSTESRIGRLRLTNGTGKDCSVLTKAGQCNNACETHEMTNENEESNEKKENVADDREIKRSEEEALCKPNKSHEAKKSVVIPLSKPAPSSWGVGLGSGSNRTSTPRKSFSLGAGISIRSVPISQLTGASHIADNAADASKSGKTAPDEVVKDEEPEKVMEGTIDILHQRLECFANPAANRGTVSNGLENGIGATSTLSSSVGALAGVQSSGASSAIGMERFRRVGDGRGLGIGGYGSSDRPLGDTKEGWKDSGWGGGALPSFASHKRTHGYHHISGRMNRGSGPNVGSNGGSGVASYGTTRSEEERKGWNRGHDGSYRGGASYGWGDSCGRNGRQRRQLD